MKRAWFGLQTRRHELQFNAAWHTASQLPETESTHRQLSERSAAEKCPPGV